MQSVFLKQIILLEGLNDNQMAIGKITGVLKGVSSGCHYL